MPLIEQLAGAVALAILVLCVASWVSAFGRLRSGEAILKHVPRRPPPWSFLDVLGAFIAFLGLPVIAVVALRAMEGGAPISLENASSQQLTAIFLAQGAANFGTAAIAVTQIVLRTGATARDLGIVWRDVRRDLTIGAGAFVMLAPPVLLIQAALTQWMPSEHPLIVLLQENFSEALFAAGVFVAVIMAPLTEELLFRVLLQGWLEKLWRPVHSADPANFTDMGGSEPMSVELPQEVSPGAVYGELIADPLKDNPYAPSSTRDLEKRRHETPGPPVPYWPIFVSAGLFALMHFSHGPDPIPLFFLALGLGYLYRQTHRILPCITVHFLLNGMSMAILWIELVLKKTPS